MPDLVALDHAIMHLKALTIEERDGYSERDARFDIGEYSLSAIRTLLAEYERLRDEMPSIREIDLDSLEGTDPC
jgi:hypothetical protein